MWHGEKEHGKNHEDWHTHCDFCGKIVYVHGIDFFYSSFDICGKCEKDVMLKIEKCIKSLIQCPVEDTTPKVDRECEMHHDDREARWDALLEAIKNSLSCGSIREQLNIAAIGEVNKLVEAIRAVEAMK